MIDADFSKADAKVLRKFERQFRRWLRAAINRQLENPGNVDALKKLLTVLAAAALLLTIKEID